MNAAIVDKPEWFKITAVGRRRQGMRIDLTSVQPASVYSVMSCAMNYVEATVELH